MKAFRQAEKLSKKGEHKLHKLGAVIAHKNTIVSHGWNKLKTHPRSTHEWKYIHAEMDAIFKAGEKAIGADLYVARIGKNGQLNCSKPCPACMAMIAAAGICRVFYTDGNIWKEMKTALSV